MQHTWNEFAAEFYLIYLPLLLRKYFTSSGKWRGSVSPCDATFSPSQIYECPFLKCGLL